MRSVAPDEWYRSGRWDRRAREGFERELAAGKPEERSELLRIKGLTLAESPLAWRRKAGVGLLHRLVREYGDDPWDASEAHALLAEFYERRGDAEQAVHHYRACWEAEQEDGHISHETALKLAALLVATGEAAESDEADRLLALKFEHGVVDSAEKWQYSVTRARLAALRGRADEAAFFARVAVRVRERNEPVYAKHPDVGLVETDRATVRDVKRLASDGNAAAYDERIERYRRRDGDVEWDWSLVERLGPHPERQERLDAYLAEADALVDDLRAAGFEVYDLSDWARRKLPSADAVKRAADVLLPWLDRATNADLEADIATALRDARARRYATEPLLRLFTDLIGDDLNGPGPPPTEEAGDRRRLKTAVGDALATLARDDHFDQVEALIRDRQHGHYRAYLFSALGHMKNPAAVDLALDMLEDGEVSMPALYALSDLGSERAEPTLRRIAGEPPPKRSADDEHADRARARIRAAKRGLEKLEKARQAGKSAP